MGKKSKSGSDTVSVVVVSHNYGRFLADCLKSILRQTRKPDQILVIDDASDDKTAKVARRFRKHNVGYRRVENRNVYLSRRDGMLHTNGCVLCFVDADDKLSRRYIQKGLAQFTDDRVAVVYSDLKCFKKSRDLKRYPRVYYSDRLQRDNFIHAGSLVRREALVQSAAFDTLIDPKITQADWFLWKKVLGQRWRARRQNAKYRYRIHGGNAHLTRQKQPSSYFDYAGLTHETVTLFIPLAGRQMFWDRLRTFLERQTWPHAQTQLILMDSSQDPEYGRMIREWAAHSDYNDIRYESVAFGRQGLADEERRQRPDVQNDVRLTMSRIYGRLSEIVDTAYCWIVEDDIVPPLDACERLLRAFDRRTDTVSGAYRSRYHDGFVVRKRKKKRRVTKPGKGIKRVAGNGFGCVILRRSCLRKAAFSSQNNFDHHFYDANNFIAKVDWSVMCQHGECSAK